MAERRIKAVHGSKGTAVVYKDTIDGDYVVRKDRAINQVYRLDSEQEAIAQAAILVGTAKVQVV